ncbi:MAG TPA: putative metal-dependent hydrolase [Phnomibacter sp.]|nr:putative metal-dependent hydrolase [Phnomibacter sp.]
MDDRYPIGQYRHQPYSAELKREWLIDIAQLPNMVEAAILNLDEDHLNTPYRDGGWTVAQVVHHLVDSHTNCYCRLKLALTEENPTIRPYDENGWVHQADSVLPVNNGTTLLHALHQRLFELFKAVTDEEWNRTYVHPDSGQHTIWYLLGMYAWHGRHHVAHINELRRRMNWT